MEEYTQYQVNSNVLNDIQSHTLTFKTRSKEHLILN